MTDGTRLTEYGAFLGSKAQMDGPGGFEPLWLPDFLFGFQSFLTAWSIWQGRGALFEDCGAGKTVQELVWAQNVHKHTGKPVLLLTPLGVRGQIIEEAERFGIEAAASGDGSITAPITVANYERLHYFNREQFAGVVCDESSVLKAFNGKRRAEVTGFMRQTPYRLLGTATPSPNDLTELGTSSEALGYLGAIDMQGMFFTNKQRALRQFGGKYRDQDAGWRLKGHAEVPFWRWIASWARAMRKPSDYGFPDDGFVLPPLEYQQHEVRPSASRDDGTLDLDLPAVGLDEWREETNRSLAERCEKAAGLLSGQDQGIAWCHFNNEGILLTHLIDGAAEVAGNDPVEAKEEKLAAFRRGEIRVLVTKPKIASYGLNFQNCHQMTYMADWSYERHYQAVRRCWRYGQQQPVTVHVITTPGGSRALEALQRKGAQADRMFSALVAHMNDALKVDRSATYDKKVEIPSWVR